MKWSGCLSSSLWCCGQWWVIAVPDQLSSEITRIMLKITQINNNIRENKKKKRILYLWPHIWGFTYTCIDVSRLSGEPLRPDDTVTHYFTTQRVRRKGSDRWEVRTPLWTMWRWRTTSFSVTWPAGGQWVTTLKAEISIPKLHVGYLLLGVETFLTSAFCSLRFVLRKFVLDFDNSIVQVFRQCADKSRQSFRLFHESQVEKHHKPSTPYISQCTAAQTMNGLFLGVSSRTGTDWNWPQEPFPYWPGLMNNITLNVCVTHIYLSSVHHPICINQ